MKWVPGDLAIFRNGLVVYDDVRRRHFREPGITVTCSCIVTEVGFLDRERSIVAVVVPGLGMRGFIEEYCLRRPQQASR